MLSNAAWAELCGTHLKRLSYDLAPGTYFSKPLPASVATPLLDAELGKLATVVE